MQWGKTWQWLQMAAGGTLTHANPPTLACTQHPGEIMVVPRVWWHATLNGPGATYGLGTQEPLENMDGTAEAQTFADTSVHSLNKFLTAHDYEGAEKRARELLTRNPAEVRNTIKIHMMYPSTVAVAGYPVAFLRHRFCCQLPVHGSLAQLLVFRCHFTPICSILPHSLHFAPRLLWFTEELRRRRSSTWMRLSRRSGA